MVYYYLDLETHSTGDRPDPSKDTIIAVILCAIDPKTGKRLQEPLLLKEWESSEKELLGALRKRLVGRPFDFIPIGFNTLFDLWFLKSKLGLDDSFYTEKPHLDLKHVAVLANKGRFKGVKLGTEGNPVRDWYEYEDYRSIEQYMLEKMDAFLEQYRMWLGALTGAQASAQPQTKK